MADLAGILMIEHMAIRHIRRRIEGNAEFLPFSEFHRYLKECHIELEEKIVFPILIAEDWPDSKSYSELANRIKADHKLLSALAENLVAWNERGDQETFRERIPLYFRLIAEHNEKEDSLVFPRWKELPSRQINETLTEARNMIDSFGKKLYMEMTGLSEGAYSYLLG